MRIIKLMADYQCFPLWEASPERIGNIDPGSLPISKSLQDELLDWADIYTRTLNWEDPANSGFFDVEAAEVFNLQGMKLANKLRKELGSEFGVILKINRFAKENRIQ